MAIFKMFDGRHIDLSKIIAVDSIDDEATEFGVWFQLFDGPLRFRRRWLNDKQNEEANAARAKVSIASIVAETGDRNGAIDRMLQAEQEVVNHYVAIYDKEFRTGHAALMDAWQQTVSAE